MAAKRRTTRRAKTAHPITAPKQPPAPVKQAILVLGMHRSGTSALTRVLGLMGADLPKNVLGPGVGNETGHWESDDLWPIHDDMLASAGTSWHDWRAVNPDWVASAAAESAKQRLLAVIRHDYADSALFTVKDPRICRFVPLWLDVLARFGATPVPVLPIRNPLEVAASLRRRDGFPLTKSYLLWLRHVLDAERASRGLPRAIVTYDMLMDDWRALVVRISEITGLRWSRRTDASELAVDRFLADAHRHHATDEAQLNARADVADWVKAAYGALLALSRGSEQEEHRRTLDRISAEFNKAASAFGLLLAGEADDAQTRIRDADARVAAATDERDAANAALADREVKLAETHNALVQAQQLAAEHTARVRTLDEELIAMRGRAHEAETHAAASRQEAERRQQELDAARALLRESQTEAQRLAGEVAQAQQQLDAARRGIEAISAERDAARALAAAREADLAAARRQMSEAADNVRAREREFDRVSQELSDTTEQLRTASADLQRLRNDAEKTDLLLGERSAALAAMRADGEKTRRELDITQNILRDTRQELDTLHTALQDARRDNGLITTALQESQRKAHDIHQERTRLESELAAAREAAATTHTELQNMRAARDSLQHKADEAARAKDEVTQLRETVRQTQAQAQRDLTARDEETARLQREIARLRTEVESQRLKQRAEERQRHDAALARRRVWPFSRLWRRSMTSRRRQDMEAIRQSGLFDPLWYLKRYPDVAAAGQDPLTHYILHGGAEGRDPHPLFDGKWYLEQYPDYAASGLSPLGHYVLEGAAKGCDPNPLFDTDWYLQQYPDVAASGLNPLHHFWTIGAAQGFDPNPLFDTSWYLGQNPDVVRTGDNPLLHYLAYGRREGRSPTPEHMHSRQEGALAEPSSATSINDPIEPEPNLETSPDLADLNKWKTKLVGDASSEGLKNVSEIGIFLHLFYADLANEVCHYLRNFPVPIHIYISTDTEQKREEIGAAFTLEGFAGKYEIKVLPNIGRDFGPFIVGFAEQIKRHDICLRIHGKKSTHNSPEFGAHWREYLFEELAGSSERIAYAISQFSNNPRLGVLMAPNWPNISDWLTIGANYEAMRSLLVRIGINIAPNQDITFPAGAMFWFRGKALTPLLELDLSWDDFTNAIGAARDATIAHAIERSILFVSAKAGYQWAFLPPFRPLKSLRLDEEYMLIQESGLFDKEFYLSNNRDVERDGADPITHFIEHGWHEGRNPSRDFDTAFYQKIISRLGASEINPLLHYIVIGRTQNLPTRRRESASAKIAVEDIYSRYRPAEQQPEFVPETFPIIRKSSIKLLAFYLPQFHPFKENDQFWGRGFTEWTNTTKAIPLFDGHYQPRLPGELGFYDTRLKEVIARQIQLAKQYGVYGFCLHHYFFDGKPIMRAPYNHILENPDLDIPFCIHWANEPWTARWDGLASKGGVLLSQHHSAEDDLSFFRDIEPALADPRYIRVDGRPLLIIYRPSLFPDIAATIERWRDACRRRGFGDLFLAVMQTGFEGQVDPCKYGFDAAIEYPPHNISLRDISAELNLYDVGFGGNIFDYNEAAELAMARPQPEYKLFRGIIPGWDCTPRRANPDIFIRETPNRYKEWLEFLCRDEEQTLAPSERFIFINAWNEWAEGAYLEPDRKYGYAYLNATAAALNNFKPVETASSKRILLGTHLYYTDLTDEFVQYFRNCPFSFDLVITTPDDQVEFVKSKINEISIPNLESVDVRPLANFGRDMGPFLFEFLPMSHRYDYCCWVHSKKSIYNSALEGWRRYLLTNLLGSETQIAAIVEQFEQNPSLGLIYPKPFKPVAHMVEWGSNFDLASKLLGRLNVSVSANEFPEFPVGGMFWFRPQALEPLLTLGLTIEDFVRHSDGPKDFSTGAVTDGTLSHALERMIGYAAKSVGFESREFMNVPA